MASRTGIALFLWTLVVLQSAYGFYLPGVAPHDFKKVLASLEERGIRGGCNLLKSRLLTLFGVLIFGWQKEELVIKVNKLSSTRNLLPYEYYSLPYCKPDKIKSTSENLGEVLRGDRILTSPYKVNYLAVVPAMDKNAECGGLYGQHGWK